MPVLCSNRGGAQEFVRHPAFIFVPSKQGDFQDKIRTIQKQPHLLKEFWEKARPVISLQKHNAIETVFTSYEKTTINRDVWYILKIDISGSNIKTYIDDVLTYSGTDSFILQQGSLFLRILETDGLVDWVRFHKHADTEPTVSVVS